VQKAYEGAWKQLDARPSLGVLVSEEGAVSDVVPGSPAATAGVTSHMKIIAVNERRFSSDVLKDAIRAAKTSGAPIALLTESSEFFHTYVVDYRGGEKYAFLERDESKPDLLSEILKPRVAVPEQPAPAVSK
jgi:hypothetical protein